MAALQDMVDVTEKRTTINKAKTVNNNVHISQHLWKTGFYPVGGGGGGGGEASPQKYFENDFFLNSCPEMQDIMCSIFCNSLLEHVVLVWEYTVAADLKHVPCYSF